MFDTSNLTDELKVCNFPKETKKILDDMGQYMNFMKIEKSVDVGTVLGHNGTSWVLADKDDVTTQNYLHIVIEKDGKDVYISNYCTISSTGQGFAYLGNEGHVVYEAPDNPIRIGVASDGKLFFVGR